LHFYNNKINVSSVIHLVTHFLIDIEKCPANHHGGEGEQEDQVETSLPLEWENQDGNANRYKRQTIEVVPTKIAPAFQAEDVSQARLWNLGQILQKKSSHLMKLSDLSSALCPYLQLTFPGEVPDCGERFSDLHSLLSQNRHRSHRKCTV
jgi:hypothetical protein